MVSAATIWMFFFTPDYGLFNQSLRLLGYTGPENWTANPSLALLAVMIVALWKERWLLYDLLSGRSAKPAHRCL